jgi:3alpha(or 20beta)-hydroxysteroid dehydrogenase
VVIGDLLDTDGAALAEQLGESARYVHLNVTSIDEWEAAVAHATSEFGGLDVLVNNAGVATVHPIEDFPIDVWSRTLDINLTGTFLGIRAAVPELAKSTRGPSIINMSSVEGLRGNAGLHAYVASKFGVGGLTKSVALDVAAQGIRVNSIHPGLIETPMINGLEDLAEALDIPMHRRAKSEEVAGLVVFLASDESSYSTGSEFIIDGGLMAGLPHH